MSIDVLANLSCHNTTPCEDVKGIYVIIRRTSGELELGFRLDGKLSRICLTPGGGPPDHTELWQHTCFEAFIAIDGQAAYHEFNFAPSREWRAHAFRAYRDPVPSTNELRSPIVAVNAADERLELDALIALADLSAIHPRSLLRLGLSAVIESRNGSLSYWALRHPPGRPDFHHADAFALCLEAPKRE
jgi:hypothetical protein